jgi:outer membrane protein TolC
MGKYLLTFFGLLVCFIGSGQVRTLDYFIQQATQNSPLLKGYQNQLLLNQLDSQILKASIRTQVNFISNNSYAPVIHGWGYDEVITNGANISALMQATRNLINRGNLAAQYRAITLQSRAMLDTIRLSIKDLYRTITEQYLTAYGDLLTMDFNSEVYDLLKREDTVFKKLTQANVYKQTDYLAFFVTAQQQQLNYMQAQIQYNVDYATLSYFAGIVDTTIERIEEPVLTESIPIDFYSSAFYQRYITDSLRIANERLLIQYSYKPRIGAFTDAGYNSSLMTTPYKNFGFSVGLNLTIPIYDSRQKRLRYQKLNIQEQIRLTNKNFFINQYNQQVGLLKKQLFATNDLVDKIKQQITYVRTLITANGKLLETGDVKITDYITAINNYLNVKNLFNQNYINQLKITNQINYWNR